MIEYIFFDTRLQNRFVEYATSLGIDCTCNDDPLGYVVAVPEEIGDTLEDLLEARYDELEHEQKELLAHESGGLSQLAGIAYSLPDGEQRMVALETEIANRLLSVMSLEEVQALFAKVAHSALVEDHRTLCQVLHGENSTY